eukprot:TRINITY_DN5270_c0_g1_i2.p1 TRINITY_DN5270_c0_g1~~TRINITY_DN5270_c0_g1_i2.p1  ORF type:complete len:515 (-),score=95.38 TRINITY_DN5270_c0_g1_i2:815-2257(-)
MKLAVSARGRISSTEEAVVSTQSTGRLFYLISSSMSWSNITSDYKKQKQIEEARKQGRLAPEKDDEGNDINPHIPEYIKKAPWYLETNAPSLKHQRVDSFQHKEFNTIDDGWYSRGQFAAPAATKYREGSCTNCGSMTHKAKDCVDRPRKVGAKYTGKDIRPDEIVKRFDLDFDGKRDRWNGFQPEMYKKVMEEYEEADALRRKQLAMKLAENFMTEPDVANKKYPHEGGETVVDKEKLVDEEEEDSRIKKEKSIDPRTRVAANNLRIREDRAKYLHNLDINSAFYDPKSRSMRENPYQGMDVKADEVTFRGDNESIFTGETRDYYKLQRYAWEEYGAANIAAPSESELLFEQYKSRRSEIEKAKKKNLTNQYGGEEYMVQVPSLSVFFLLLHPISTFTSILKLNDPRALRLGQVEEYREYAPDGSLLPAYQSTIPRSKYPEDVLLNNHTTVWVRGMTEKQENGVTSVVDRHTNKHLLYW